MWLNIWSSGSLLPQHHSFHITAFRASRLQTLVGALQPGTGNFSLERLVSMGVFQWHVRPTRRYFMEFHGISRYIFLCFSHKQLPSAKKRSDTVRLSVFPYTYIQNQSNSYTWILVWTENLKKIRYDQIFSHILYIHRKSYWWVAFGGLTMLT